MISFEHDVFLVADRAGIVTQPMLDTPKKQFLLIGALEAASSILGFIGAAKLPGMPRLYPDTHGMVLVFS